MYVKIGRTDEVERRMHQWNHKCVSNAYNLRFSRRTRYQMRLERLLLLVLGDMEEHMAYQLPKFPNVSPPARNGTSKEKELCVNCKCACVAFGPN